MTCHLSMASQPPPSLGLPTTANEQTAAYVGSRCAACPGPPANPPSGCWRASNVSMDLWGSHKSHLDVDVYVNLPLLCHIIKACPEYAEAVQGPVDQPRLAGVLRDISFRKSLPQVAQKKFKVGSLLELWLSATRGRNVRLDHILRRGLESGGRGAIPVYRGR